MKYVPKNRIVNEVFKTVDTKKTRNLKPLKRTNLSVKSNGQVRLSRHAEAFTGFEPKKKVSQPFYPTLPETNKKRLDFNPYRAKAYNMSPIEVTHNLEVKSNYPEFSETNSFWKNPLLMDITPEYNGKNLLSELNSQISHQCLPNEDKLGRPKLIITPEAKLFQKTIEEDLKGEINSPSPERRSRSANHKGLDFTDRKMDNSVSIFKRGDFNDFENSAEKSSLTQLPMSNQYCFGGYDTDKAFKDLIDSRRKKSSVDDYNYNYNLKSNREDSADSNFSFNFRKYD